MLINFMDNMRLSVPDWRTGEIAPRDVCDAVMGEEMRAMFYLQNTILYI